MPTVKADLTLDSTQFVSELLKQVQTTNEFGRRGAAAMERTEAATKKAASSVSTLGNLVKAVGAAWAAIRSAEAVVEWAKIGDAANSARDAFLGVARAAGIDGKRGIEEMQQAARGQVATVDLLTRANRAFELGAVQNIGQMKMLIEFSQVAAKKYGLTMEEAFDKTVTGFARGSKLILDDVGIQIDGAFQVETAWESVRQQLAQAPPLVDDFTSRTTRLANQWTDTKAAIGSVVGELEGSFDKAITATLTNAKNAFSGLAADLRGFQSSTKKSKDGLFELEDALGNAMAIGALGIFGLISAWNMLEVSVQQTIASVKWFAAALTFDQQGMRKADIEINKVSRTYVQTQERMRTALLNFTGAASPELGRLFQAYGLVDQKAKDAADSTEKLGASQRGAGDSADEAAKEQQRTNEALKGGAQGSGETEDALAGLDLGTRAYIETLRADEVALQAQIDALGGNTEATAVYRTELDRTHALIAETIERAKQDVAAREATTVAITAQNRALETQAQLYERLGLLRGAEAQAQEDEDHRAALARAKLGFTSGASFEQQQAFDRQNALSQAKLDTSVSTSGVGTIGAPIGGGINLTVNTTASPEQTAEILMARLRQEQQLQGVAGSPFTVSSPRF